MIKIRVAGICPTGTTTDWSDWKEVYVHEALAYDFVKNLIDYALHESQAEHWQYEDLGEEEE